MYGVSTNVGFGSVIDDLDQTHLTVRRFELARTSMTSWHVVFTKATHAIGGYGPTALQENRMRAAAERQCGKPCLWLYYGPRMGNEQGSNNDVLYVSSILGLGFLSPLPNSNAWVCYRSPASRIPNINSRSVAPGGSVSPSSTSGRNQTKDMATVILGTRAYRARDNGNSP